MLRVHGSRAILCLFAALVWMQFFYPNLNSCGPFHFAFVPFVALACLLSSNHSFTHSHCSSQAFASFSHFACVTHSNSNIFVSTNLRSAHSAMGSFSKTNEIRERSFANMLTGTGSVCYLCIYFWLLFLIQNTHKERETERRT